MEVITIRRYNVLVIETIVLLLVPIILICLPSDFFDEGQSLCLSVLLFDTECFGCGMTRSIMHLLHLNFRESFYHNPLGILVAIIIGFIIISKLKKNLLALRTKPISP